MDYLFLLAGLFGLLLGGEALVRGSVGIAQRLSLSPLLIGLTVVGFGTSTPELLVSVDAAWRGVPDIALGNVLGSNIANILLIAGLSALIWPIRAGSTGIGRDLLVMIGAALLLIPFFAMGQIGRVGGLILCAGLVTYLVTVYRQAEPPAAGTVTPPAPGSAWLAGLTVLTGLAGLMLGARLLVDGAVAIARDHALSEAFIGLTIVAVGTSLPELATSPIAALRRQSDIAIGNIVGSNIFNVLGILGLTAIITPVPVASRFLVVDLPIVIGVSVLLGALLLGRRSIGRLAGFGMLLAYGAYVWAAQG